MKFIINPTTVFGLLALLISLVASSPSGTPIAAVLAARATVAPEIPQFPRVSNDEWYIGKTFGNFPSPLICISISSSKITNLIHFPLPIILDRRYLWNGQSFLYGIHKTLLRQVGK